MKTVLQPLNEKAAKIVTEHADLLEGASVEPLLLQLVAHVSAYKVILERFDLINKRHACQCESTLLGASFPICSITAFTMRYTMV